MLRVGIPSITVWISWFVEQPYPERVSVRLTLTAEAPSEQWDILPWEAVALKRVIAT
jgi:hypothetical protein